MPITYQLQLSINWPILQCVECTANYSIKLKSKWTENRNKKRDFPT